MIYQVGLRDDQVGNSGFLHRRDGEPDGDRVVSVQLDLTDAGNDQIKWDCFILSNEFTASKFSCILCKGTIDCEDGNIERNVVPASVWKIIQDSIK